MIGAYAYLGPKAGRDTFGIDGQTADLVFGAVTVLTGVLGPSFLLFFFPSLQPKCALVLVLGVVPLLGMQMYLGGTLVSLSYGWLQLLYL